MHSRNIRLTKAIQENFSLIMAYAYSREPLSRAIDERFVGEWKYLRAALFELTEEKVQRAILELAILLRLLDDEEQIARYLKDNSNLSFGTIVQSDGTKTPMYYRDLTNKILHSSSISWNLEDPSEPKIACTAAPDDKWTKAEISLIALAGLCGQLMF